jgi:hypothetical protein
MYERLRRRFSHRTALVLTAVWYISLLLAVLYCAFEPQAELKYLAL